MRKGVIDQILMMLMVFVFLVTIFFLIIDYSFVGKIQNQFDMMSRQGSRFVSLGKDDDDIINMINNLNIKYFKSVDNSNLDCQIIENNLSKVFFQLNGIFHSRFELLGNQGDILVSSTSVAYNENSSDEINCTITLEKEEDL